MFVYQNRSELSGRAHYEGVRLSGQVICILEAALDSKSDETRVAWEVSIADQIGDYEGDLGGAD